MVEFGKHYTCSFESCELQSLQDLQSCDPSVLPSFCAVKERAFHLRIWDVWFYWTPSTQEVWSPTRPWNVWHVGTGPIRACHLFWFPNCATFCGPLGCMLLLLIACQEFLSQPMFVGMNCEDIKVIHKVGQTWHWKPMFALFMRCKHKYGTKKQKIGSQSRDNLFFHHRSNMKLVSYQVEASYYAPAKT